MAKRSKVDLEALAQEVAKTANGVAAEEPEGITLHEYSVSPDGELTETGSEIVAIEPVELETLKGKDEITESDAVAAAKLLAAKSSKVAAALAEPEVRVTEAPKTEKPVKEKQPRGVLNRKKHSGYASLTPELVLAIVADVASGTPEKELQGKYNVSIYAAFQIARGFMFVADILEQGGKLDEAIAYLRKTPIEAEMSKPEVESEESPAEKELAVAS